MQRRYPLEVFGQPVKGDAFATHRRFTGYPINRAYVISHSTGKVLMACGHQHRRGWTAQRCAEGMLRAAIKAAGG